MRVVLGDPLIESLRGKTVVDFGCGSGDGAVDLARFGAKRVIGVDVREDLLSEARQNARVAGVEHLCGFLSTAEG